MADLIASAISIQNNNGAGGTARIQIFGGTAPYQFLIADFECNSAATTSLTTAIQNSSATATTVQFAAGASPLPGVYNAI